MVAREDNCLSQSVKSRTGLPSENFLQTAGNGGMPAAANFKETDMAQIITFARTGGPEVLELQTVSVGEPGPGQVRLQQKAVGLNYADTYFRTGI